MLRRFSTFKKSKSDRDQEPKENGTVTTKQSKRQSKLLAVRKPSVEEDHSAKRTEVASVFEKHAQLLHASQRPLPNQNGDGTYQDHDSSSGLFQDVKSMGFKDVNTLKDLVKSKASGETVDDKTMLMERIIQLVSGLPSHSKNRVELTNAFLDELWESLPHPPLSYMGNDYAYRTADGSNNNPTLPWLGAANTAYCRSIAPMTIQPGGLPDPGLVFDSLYARQEFHPHPNKVSSVFFDWASLIIHDIFQTDHRNPHMNKTSSYLDLAILYGDIQEQQDQIRTHKDGRLKPDTFSEARLQALPPACGVLLVMLNRFHNHVVEELATINEGGRFTKPRDGLPEELAKQAWAKYDEDLFQTGRLITCGLYINITLYDYLRTIVNLNRTNSTWCLDPRAQMEKAGATPSGLGNQCSVEFNLAYRWHSAISSNDEKWTEKVFQELLGKPSNQLSMQDLLIGLGKYEQSLTPDPSKRTFAHLQRQEDGTFKDEELVSILCNAVEDVAGSFGARNVPKALRSVEILGISEARRWNVGSLNEFRKFFNLKPYETFEEINSDPDVANSLRHLYEHPDFVELYPGIVSEEAKEPMAPGVGIAPTYTVSRAVLSDAVALVRGDRHYTVDYNPKNLTNWGYSEVRYDLNVNQGCVFYKLVHNAFPNHFKTDSIYAHYPMTIPSENRKIMKDLGRESHFSYDRPAYRAPPVHLTSHVNAKLVLEQQKNFRLVPSDDPEPLFGNVSKELGENALKSVDQTQWNKTVKEFFEDVTLTLLQEKTGKLAGINQIDITRDVGNLAHAHFLSKVFSLPLKTTENPRGVFTEHEMYMIMATIYIHIYFDTEQTRSFALRHATNAVAQQLATVIESSVKGNGGLLSNLFGGHNHHNVLADYGKELVGRFKERGLNPSQIAWSKIIPTAGALVPNQAQFTEIIDYYLSEEGKQHLPEINRLAKEDTPESDEKLGRYCLEAIRINGTFGSFRQAETGLTVNEDGREVQVKPGDRVFVSFVKANHDPEIFPGPNEVRLDRPIDSYIFYNHGAETILGKDASVIALASMLRVVGRLDNLRRAPGAQGQLKRYERKDGHSVYLREDFSSFFPFPMTFKVHYDGELPALKRRATSS